MSIKQEYAEVLKDWKYLFETIAPADDMTGGYEDQRDLDKMLKNPTRKQAVYCLICQIEYWLEKGPEKYLTSHDWQNDKKVDEIRNKYE